MLARRYAAALRQGHSRKLLIVGVGRQIGRYCRRSIDQPTSDEHTDSPEPYDGHGEQRQLLYLAHVENYSFASGVATCPSGPWRRPPALRPAARNVSARRGLQDPANWDCQAAPFRRALAGVFDPIDAGVM